MLKKPPPLETIGAPYPYPPYMGAPYHPKELMLTEGLLHRPGNMNAGETQLQGSP